MPFGRVRPPPVTLVCWLLRVVIFPDGSCEDLGVDESLTFLDHFVEEAIRRGASRYAPPPDQDEDGTVTTGRSVCFVKIARLVD